MATDKASFSAIPALMLALFAGACGGQSPLVPPGGPPAAGFVPFPPVPAPVLAPSSAVIAGPEASSVTFERMAKWPEPGWHVPGSIAYSPDGKLVTYLQSEKEDEETALFAFDRNSRETRVLLRAGDLGKPPATMTREEELRRERQRQKNKGITSYRWAKRAPLLVVPYGGDVFVRKADGKIVKLTDTPEPEIDPQPCDSGERVAFVRKGELFAVDVAGPREMQLTRGAPEGVTRGLSDFNGQEEFHEPNGYWWSPRCDRIAYLEVDERGVEQVPVVGYRGPRADVMMQRYPAAGGKNPIVRLVVVEIASRRTTVVDLPAEAGKERYLGRFNWSADGRSLFFQALSRDQKRLQLLRMDNEKPMARVLATETSPSFVQFAQVLLFERSPRLLWTRNHEGYQHLELLDVANGASVAQITQGNWDVESVEGVDEEQGRVLFTGTKDGPLERHLYGASLLSPVDPVRFTPEPGVHRVTKEDAGSSWVDVHSALDRPPRAAVYDASGAVVGELPCPLDADFAALRIRSPEPVAVRGASGDTLYGALLRPRQMLPGQRYPVVVMVYGGPGTQTVQNKWSAHLLWQHLADRGIAVFQLDNRGTPGRGRTFAQSTYGKLGELELADQLAGLDFLATLPFVDMQRVGIYGHSYGGFMAALAMMRAPTRFRVGVAGSPVTDWRLYDTGYTERFMGDPEQNASGYAAGDLSTMVSGLSGKLLIIHAMMDENVHFQNSARLIDALTNAQKPFDLLVFPGERHGYRSPTARQYASMRVADYFARNL